MPSFNKFNCFTEDLGKGIHVFGTHSLKIALTNTAPTASNAVLADITEISYTNCSSRAVTTTSYVQTSGVAKLILVDPVLTASGTVGPFRYVVLYNDTATSKNLIGWYDIGSSYTLSNSGDTFTTDFDQSGGVFTLT